MTPEDLVEMEAIKRLKYRYLRLIDLKAWGELPELFCEDATVAYSDGRYSYSGRDQIVSWLRHTMASENMLTSHKVHHPEIVLTGAGSAVATWALDDVVVNLDYNVTVRGAAFYKDEYLKVDGEWKIKHTGYERIYEEMQPRSPDIDLLSRRRAPEG